MTERRVLIVEDHPGTAETLHRILTRQGWKTSVATTLVDALASLISPPECVILDVMLPDGNGIDVLRAVRERNLTTRVVITTASGDPDHSCAAGSFAPDVVLRKPYTFNDLRAAMEPSPGPVPPSGPAVSFMTSSPLHPKA